MPEHDHHRLALANEVYNQIALENLLQPIQARSFVRSLQTTWQVPTIQWSEDESQSQLEDAHRLIHAADLFQRLEGKDSSQAVDCFRRAGELLEWLARAADPVNSALPIELLAAAAYQLGAMPAMAVGLLAQIQSDNPESHLYASFLSADFDGVLHAAAEFWRQHLHLIERQAMHELLLDDEEDGFSWYIVVEIVRCLGLISDSLRRGNNERLNRALEKLESLDKVALRTLPEEISLFLSLLNGVANEYKSCNIYLPISQLAELNPDYRSRLHSFARGQFSRGRGILWTSQLSGLQRLLEDSSFALCTPTGSGKTLVANLALVKELLLVEDEGLAPLALYLVPSRALAGEVERKLTSELGSHFIVTGLYGGSDWGITDYWLDADQPTVLIATVEKADALMRYLGPLLVSRLRLLIVDEAHQVVGEESESGRAAFAEHGSRPIRLEALVSRILSLSPGIVRIALTAVAGGAAMPVARWIEGRSNAEAVGSRYRSTRQVIGRLECRTNRSSQILLDFMNDRRLFVRGRDEPVYLNLRIPPMPQPPARVRNSLNRFNQHNILWTALHLLEGDRRILISVTQQPERTMSWYVEAFSFPEWRDLGEFSPPEDEEDRETFYEARATCIDYCGDSSYELLLLDRGIATNHGQMPQRLRRLMTDLVDRRICPLTIATATLTEGVNLPFDLILVTSLKRSYFDNTKQQLVDHSLSTAEFRNLAGRAGRPGASAGMEGMTLIGVPRSVSTTAAGQIATQRRQVRDRNNEYENFMQRLQEEGVDHNNAASPLSLLLQAIYQKAREVLGIRDEEEFLGWLEAVLPEDVSDQAGSGARDRQAVLADTVDELDGVLVSMIEELGRAENRSLDGPEAEVFLSEVWRRTFTNYASVQEDWMERAFVRRGRAIVEEVYADANERRRLYQYGFPPHIGRRFETVRRYFRQVLEESSGYGVAQPDEQIAVFERLGEVLVEDRGYGFRTRNSETELELMERWQDLLAWWMQGPDAPEPEPAELRSWQRFVMENLEFRMGVAVGAVVAEAWSESAGDPTAVPSLATWRETTALPWFGFWAKELLRWGTLDPFVAFCLAQGLSRTREEAEGPRSDFEAWLEEEVEDISADDHIDPQYFLQWRREQPLERRRRRHQEPVEAELTGTNGNRGRYAVMPLERNGTIEWLDASGYGLARSERRPNWIRDEALRDDFELRIEDDGATVRRVFVAP